MKRLLLNATNHSTAGRLVSLLERFDNRSRPLLRVLTYHRVADPQQMPHQYPRVTVRPEMFEQHMRHISSQYQVVSMAEVLEAVQSGAPLPERAVLITFDDAYRDFAENAMPVLRRYNLPVTLFVPTAFPDQPKLAFWWDKLYAGIECASTLELIQTPVGLLPVESAEQRRETYSQLRTYVKSTPHQAAIAWVNQFCEELEAPSITDSVLSWQELRELAREGVTLGPHTRTHPMMDQISSAEARAEASGSRQDLREQVGEPLPIFAYPSGGYTPEVVQILAEEGFCLAFTTERGLNDYPLLDHLQLKRINVGPMTTLPLFRAQLLSLMKLYRA